MFLYDKKLQYPVKIDKPNPKLAAIIISQYGGPDGELGASLRYLSQRYAMPFDELKGLLTDIGTEGSKWNMHHLSQAKYSVINRTKLSTIGCILNKYVFFGTGVFCIISITQSMKPLYFIRILNVVFCQITYHFTTSHLAHGPLLYHLSLLFFSKNTGNEANIFRKKFRNTGAIFFGG